MSELKNIEIGKLEFNNGQIEGLPKNPRKIKAEQLQKLKKSIEDAPEMLEYRRLLVYPIKGQSIVKYVVICGNMRLKAAKAVGYAEMPCFVLPEDTPKEKLREYAIKDNIGFGVDDWELLQSEWDKGELLSWGMELPTRKEKEEEAGELDFAEILNEEHNYVVLYFDNMVDWLQIESILGLKPQVCASTRADGVLKDNMKRIGIGRVVKGREAMEKLRKHYENFR